MHAAGAAPASPAAVQTPDASRSASPASPPQPTRPGGSPPPLKPPSVHAPSKAVSPTRPNVMFSVLGGMRKSVETFSTEAANVLSRVTGGGSHEAAAPAGPQDEASPAAQVRFSPPPDLASPPQPTAATPNAANAGEAAMWHHILTHMPPGRMHATCWGQLITPVSLLPSRRGLPHGASIRCHMGAATLAAWHL